MAATPQEKKKFMAKGMEKVDEGLPGWFGTFADMMTPVSYTHLTLPTKRIV